MTKINALTRLEEESGLYDGKTVLFEKDHPAEILKLIAALILEGKFIKWSAHKTNKSRNCLENFKYLVSEHMENQDSKVLQQISNTKQTLNNI